MEMSTVMFLLGWAAGYLLTVALAYREWVDYNLDGDDFLLAGILGLFFWFVIIWAFLPDGVYEAIKAHRERAYDKRRQKGSHS